MKSAEKSCPYPKEWVEFEVKHPNATIKEILDFQDELKERAARERNFEAMAIYGMPQWFYLANRAECEARQRRSNPQPRRHCETATAGEAIHKASQI